MSETHFSIANDIQSKFNFYLIGLCFTLLALSIQTANFQGSVPQTILEITGWFCLLASGLSGLWHLEWIPSIYRIADLRNDWQVDKNQLEDAKHQGLSVAHTKGEGRQVPIDEVIKKVEKKIQKSDDYRNELEKHSEKKYKFHRISFVVGIVLLVSARAYSPIFSLICK